MTRHAVALIVLGLLLAPAPGRADWQLNGTTLASFNNWQEQSAMVPDGAGGAIIVWQDPLTLVEFDIFAQRIDVRGEPQWGPAGAVVCTASGNQWFFQATADGAGGVIVAWQDDREGNADIYAQRIGPDGARLWTAGGVAICNTAATQQNPTLVSDLAAGAIVSWQDDRGSTGFDIYTQRVDASGVTQWTANGVELARGALNQTYPTSVSNGLGGAIVVFLDNRNETSGDLYVRGVNANGIPTGTNGGTPLCTAAGQQAKPAIVSDGETGALVVWQDARGGSLGIYGQRLNSNGVSQWTSDGVEICAQLGDQTQPTCVEDGAGGMIVSWEDRRYDPGNADVYAQRLNGAGTLLWYWSGLPVTEVQNNQTGISMAGDGDGGAIITWYDARNMSGDIYAERIDAAGSLHWSPGGSPVCRAIGSQNSARVVADGAGGGLFVWTDIRVVSYKQVYAQRLEARYGEWGTPEPQLTSVADNPGDEGGQVIVRWQASGRDRFDDPLIAYYSLWRATDLAAAQGGPIADPAALSVDFEGSLFWRDGNETYWEWVANQPAAYLPSYSLLAPTRQDSLGSDPATHEFMVLAHDGSSPVRIWESNTAEGHSVDNLAPAQPLDLMAERLGADVALDWTPVPSGDLREYAVYRGVAPGVQPSPEAFLAWSSDPFLVDVGAPETDLYYVVSAVDVHDNESPPSNEASVLAETAAGDPALPSALTVRPNWPNPFRGATALSIGLPRRSDLRVSVFDVNGRRVVLEQRTGVASGWQVLDLSARERDGRSLPSGVYLYRVEACGASVVGKLTIAR